MCGSPFFIFRQLFYPNQPCRIVLSIQITRRMVVFWLTNFKKNGNGKKPSAPKMPGEWLYLNKEELPLRKIYELFKEEQTAEYWEAAGVLEISLPESGTLDMEDLEGTLGDDEGDAYLLQNGIHTVFAATIRPEDYEKAKEIMFFITKKLGGYFCADTADFKPIVAAK